MTCTPGRLGSLARETSVRADDPIPGAPGGDDYQGIWISPDDSNTLVLASDQGTIVTRNATAADPRDGRGQPVDRQLPAIPGA